jgi:hypothetical protein
VKWRFFVSRHSGPEVYSVTPDFSFAIGIFAKGYGACTVTILIDASAGFPPTVDRIS